jgi:hypothetical protein
MSLDRRIGRLEQGSHLGGEDDDVFFMRVPGNYQADPQYEKTKAYVGKLGKSLILLDSPASHSLPLWGLVTMDGLPDELLDEQIKDLERRIAAEASAVAMTGETANG